MKTKSRIPGKSGSDKVNIITLGCSKNTVDSEMLMGQLAAGGKTAAISGEPPKSRIVLSVFENMEKAQAAYTSPEYLEARKVGDKYAKLRIFVVEGVAQK